MSGAGAVLSRVRGTIVVTFQGAAQADALVAASRALMTELGRRHTDAVVFEVSGCEVIDLEEFNALRKLTQQVQWLGVRSVIAGVRPGIVAYLVSAGVPTNGLRLTRNLEQALFEIDFKRRPKRL